MSDGPQDDEEMETSGSPDNPPDDNGPPSTEEWRQRSLAQIESMLTRDVRKPMMGLLAELLHVRPDMDALAEAAKDDPLKYIRTIKTVAELVTPKEVHTYQVSADAKDIIAEMQRRGLADTEVARKLGRSVGITVDGEYQAVPDNED